MNDWKTTQLGEIAKFTSGGTPSKQNAAFWGGDYPWISGKDLKQHYLKTSIDTLTKTGFENAKIAPTGASLILVRGMTLLKDFPVGFATKPMAFNQDVKALIPKDEIDDLFFSYLLVGNKVSIRGLVSTAGHGTGRLDSQSIKDYAIKLPPLAEQKKIATILETWDKAIVITEQLVEQGRLQKKALAQQTLKIKKSICGIKSGWKLTSLRELLSIRTIKQVPNEQVPLYSLTIAKGITAKTARYNRDFLVKNSDGKKYKLVMPNDIVYNPANLRWGAINYSRLSCCVVVSPIYEVLFLKNPNLNCHRFLSQLLMSDTQIAKFATMIEGTVMERKAVKIQPFLATKVMMPTTLCEQQKIAKILTTADNEIAALQQKLDYFKQEKKALMQQLLTGRRRVKVE
ncbi:MAG: restriction endonuclease subunit S [Algicola sp.]|nr:restriction endonuclease subunit S [Algicola sp.]